MTDLAHAQIHGSLLDFSMVFYRFGHIILHLQLLILSWKMLFVKSWRVKSWREIAPEYTLTLHSNKSVVAEDRGCKDGTSRWQRQRGCISFSTYPPTYASMCVHFSLSFGTAFHWIPFLPCLSLSLGSAIQGSLIIPLYAVISWM